MDLPVRPYRPTLLCTASITRLECLGIHSAHLCMCLLLILRRQPELLQVVLGSGAVTPDTVQV